MMAVKLHRNEEAVMLYSPRKLSILERKFELHTPAERNLIDASEKGKKNIVAMVGDGQQPCRCCANITCVSAVPGPSNLRS